MGDEGGHGNDPRTLTEKINSDLTNARLRRELMKSVLESHGLESVMRPTIVLAMDDTRLAIESYMEMLNLADYDALSQGMITDALAELTSILSELLTCHREMKDPLDSSLLTDH